MTTSKIVLLNIILFVAIVGLSAMIITEQREVPGEPPIEELREIVKEEIEKGRQNPAGNSNLKSLGTVNMFDDLVPKPTPSPTPPPTPVPPVKPEELTQYWKLNGVLPSFATFQNIKTNVDITIKVGESVNENYRGKDIPVFLESTDFKKFTATIMIKEGGIIQKRTFKLFEQ